MTKVVIIDDEKDVVDSMKILLSENFNNIEVIGTANSVLEGIKEIKTKKPDLVFLDISMPVADGFDLLDCLPDRDFQTIFVTAHDNFAIRAIKAQALDYLLKPVDLDDLTAAIKRAQNEIKKVHQSSNSYLVKENDLRITISSQDGFYYTSIKKIVHVKAEGSYSTVFISGEKPLLVSRHLKEFETLLEENGFMRVHKSHLINLAHVIKFIKEDGGYAIMSDGSKIEISRYKKDDFVKAMGLAM